MIRGVNPTRILCRRPRLPAQPGRHGGRNTRAAPATDGAQTQTAQAPLGRSSPLFWTVLRETWDRCKDVLVIVKPDTVVKWHRVGFRLYWRWKSRPRGGRPRISQEVRAPIARLAHENPDWGAPKIHGKLQKLCVALSERTVARYLRRIQRRGDPCKKWLAFLRNHREAIVAFDFFTMPTVTFGAAAARSWITSLH